MKRYLLLLFLCAAACSAVKIGRPFAVDPRGDLKVGHDRKADVVKKMGEPYRRFVDSGGHEVFTYVYADGNGGGSKAIIAFNKNDVVYLVEVVP
jgi:hypothetical protein